MSTNRFAERPELSVVVPIAERIEDPGDLFEDYIRELNGLGKPFELIIVVDGGQSWLVPRLTEIKRLSPSISLHVLGRTFGEAAALTVGFRQARSDVIVTLPAYPQVEPAGIRDVLSKLDEGADMAVGRRHPRLDSAFNRLQSAVFHWMMRLLTRARFNDVSCGLRALRKNVADELEIYGDLHRFIPLIAINQGFNVVETQVRQSGKQRKLRIHALGAYPRRLLDLLTVFFLVKFTRKPLRFFGLIGTALFVPGVLLVGYLGVYRILGLGGIGNRPLLLMGVLLMVLGFQTLSIGLLGEIIIFVHARKLREYSVAQVIRADRSEERRATASPSPSLFDTR